MWRLVVLLLGWVSLQAQPRSCSYGEVWSPFYSGQQTEDAEPTVRNGPPCDDLCCIPVVFHVMQHADDPIVSDAFLMEQIHRLNRDFAGTNPDRDRVPGEFSAYQGAFPYRFCLAEMETGGPAIIRRQTTRKNLGLSEDIFYTESGGSTAIAPERHLNIWIAAMGNNLSGASSKPGSELAERSGVVINPLFFSSLAHPQYSLGRVLTHEIGHYLGLDHIWGPGYGCDLDDNIADTPDQEAPYVGCPTHPVMSCGTADMFMNFMDYVDDACMVMFTYDQVEWMLATINLFRPELLQYTDVCIRPQVRESLIVYPNPASDVLQILPGLQQLGGPGDECILINVLGQTILSRALTDQDANGFCLDMLKIPDGRYVIAIRNQGRILGATNVTVVR